jgi:hypothetical protein
MGPGFSHGPVFMKINLFIFHCPPQTLEKNVVIDLAPAVHADPNPALFQKPGELLARKLWPLVRVKDLRL